MAVTKAPLMSLGASGALAKTLVFFPWKGLHAVRSWVVPANPQSTRQVAQRANLTAAVALIHTAMQDATHPLVAADQAAYSNKAATENSPRTWFNEAAKICVDQLVATLKPAVYGDGVMVVAGADVTCSLYFFKTGANSITAGSFKWGYSKTNLLNTEAATVAAEHLSCTITAPDITRPIYVQFQPSAHADYVGANSGIYLVATS